MNEEFITNAIEKDRYLKADRLVDRFEEILNRELENTYKQIVEDNPALFPNDVTIDSGNHEAGESLRTFRVYAPLKKVDSDDEESNRLQLYLGIEWTEPEVRGEESPSNTSLCVVLYKVRTPSRPRSTPLEDYETVKHKTIADEDWNLRFGDDIHTSDVKTIYTPVNNAEELKQGLTELREHFSAYGHEFGTDP